VGDLSSISSSSGYLRALAEILKRFPEHMHLFAGAGDIRAFRGFLHSEGVLTRIRFLGDMSDVTPLLVASDIYFASFPSFDAEPILAARGAGVPVLVLQSNRKPSDGPAAGASELSAANEPEYVEIASRFLRNLKARATQPQESPAGAANPAQLSLFPR
jgi:hypothetical protein